MSNWFKSPVIIIFELGFTTNNLSHVSIRNSMRSWLWHSGFGGWYTHSEFCVVITLGRHSNRLWNSDNSSTYDFYTTPRRFSLSFLMIENPFGHIKLCGTSLFNHVSETLQVSMLFVISCAYKLSLTSTLLLNCVPFQYIARSLLKFAPRYRPLLHLWCKDW